MATTQKWSAWRRRPPLSTVMAYFASHAADHAAGLAFNAFLSMFPLMLGAFLVAVGASVGISTALAIEPGFAVLGFGFGWIVMTALLLVIYRVVPNRRTRFSEVWPGALVAGLSIELLNLAFPIYLHLTRSAATYGRSFGFLFVVGTWTYLLSMVLLLGAVINRMRFDRGRLEGKDQ